MKPSLHSGVNLEPVGRRWGELTHAQRCFTGMENYPSSSFPIQSPSLARLFTRSGTGSQEKAAVAKQQGTQLQSRLERHFWSHNSGNKRQQNCDICASGVFLHPHRQPSPQPLPLVKELLPVEFLSTTYLNKVREIKSPERSFVRVTPRTLLRLSQASLIKSPANSYISWVSKERKSAASCRCLTSLTQLRSRSGG